MLAILQYKQVLPGDLGLWQEPFHVLRLIHELDLTQ